MFENMTYVDELVYSGQPPYIFFLDPPLFPSNWSGLNTKFKPSQPVLTQTQIEAPGGRGNVSGTRMVRHPSWLSSKLIDEMC